MGYDNLYFYISPLLKQFVVTKSVQHPSILQQILQSNRILFHLKPFINFPSACLFLYLLGLSVIFMTSLSPSLPTPCPAGVMCTAPQPDGADGKNLGEEQEETPQDRWKHQEETVGAGFQHLQRFFQCV